jgi:hypothetical protein
MAFRLSLSMTLFVTLAILRVHGQNGFWSNKYASAMITSPTPFTQVVTGADTWPLGTVKHYVLASSACTKYFLSITKAASFFQATVTNPNICSWPSCTAPGYGQAGCQTGTPSGWANYQNVYPFSLEWWDTSTTAIYVLPTRQNTPIGMTPEATTFTITQALATSMATASMRLLLTIIPRQTNLFTMSIPGWYYAFPYASSPANWKQVDYTNLLPIVGASGRLGLQYFLQGQVSDSGVYYTTQNWFRRKQPTPQFYFKAQWGSGCWSSNYFQLINLCGWYALSYYYSSANDWINQQITCTNSICADSWTNTANPGTVSTLAWEFFEEFRVYSNNVTLTWATVFNNVSSASNGYSMVVQTDGNASFPLRLSWANITDVADCCTVSDIVAKQRSYIGVFIVPPFAVQDLWITVHDENGNRLFTEVDKRVPYRGSTAGPSQPGWHLALSNRVYASQRMNVVVRWNRRNQIGTREEEIRANQLIGFVTDNGGSVSLLTAPIPLTIVSGSGIMGAVAAQAFTANQWMANISFQSCITGNMTAQLWLAKLQYKLNRTAAFNAYWFNTTTVPFLQEQILMTIMLTAGLPSQIDQSTHFWTIADGMYPTKPTMLPHFWDQSLLMRLLGFTEIPTFVNTELGTWTFEYGLIASAWPWFGVEVTSSQYVACRAHVRRGLIVSPANEAFLPAYVHMFRHSSSSTANTKISVEWSTNMVRLNAISNIPFQGEIFPDFNAPSFYKQQYLLRYGAVPPNALDACTVPNYDGYLDYTSSSRATLVNRWAALYSEPYKASLARAISAFSQKISNLPAAVNGLGSTPEQVQMAITLLSAERDVLAWQITDANAEYAALP